MLITSLFSYIFFFFFFPFCLFRNAARPAGKRRRPAEVMHLAVVACGNRLEETLTMIKSALLFSLKRIMFHIFAEDPLAPQFTERVKFTGQVFSPAEDRLLRALHVSMMPVYSLPLWWMISGPERFLPLTPYTYIILLSRGLDIIYNQDSPFFPPALLSPQSHL